MNGNWIIEINNGTSIEGSKSYYETGIDFEYFPDKYDHKVSFGIASEVEFRSHDEFYLGPIFSYYYMHFKLFYSTGLFTDFESSKWKNRFGVGYEFVIKKYYLIIPTVIYNRVNSENVTSLGIGLAHEF